MSDPASFQKLDLTASRDTELDLSTDNVVKSAPLGGLPKAGFTLAIIILSIIAAYLIFLGVYIVSNKSTALDKIDFSSKTVAADSTIFAHQQALIQLYQAEQKSSRDFMVQISQLVLLNLLLPTLTAILGYIFGSREEARRQSS